MMIFKAIVEIPKDSYYKFEQDKDSNLLKLDRVLPISCPYNYGYLPNSLSKDGDPTDIFIVSEFSISPLTEVQFRPLGILFCEDNGVEDNKVIAKIEGDCFIDFEYFSKIKFYLENYKKGFQIKDYKVINDPIIFKNLINYL